MKYLCLGYLEEKKWEAMSKNEQEAFIDECFAYDDALRMGGHFLGGEALQRARSAATLRFQTARRPSLTARTPKRMNSWAEFCYLRPTSC